MTCTDLWGGPGFCLSQMCEIWIPFHPYYSSNQCAGLAPESCGPCEEPPMQIAEIQVGGETYQVSPPLSYVLRREGGHVFAEAEEFGLFTCAEDRASAREEIRRQFAALIEGYALEKDYALAPSGKGLKRKLLARLKGCKDVERTGT